MPPPYGVGAPGFYVSICWAYGNLGRSIDIQLNCPLQQSPHQWRQALPYRPPGTDACAVAVQMVELASAKFVCIVDESKLVEGLGGSKGTIAYRLSFVCKAGHMKQDKLLQ